MSRFERLTYSRVIITLTRGNIRSRSFHSATALNKRKFSPSNAARSRIVYSRNLTNTHNIRSECDILSEIGVTEPPSPAGTAFNMLSYVYNAYRRTHTRTRSHTYTYNYRKKTASIRSQFRLVSARPLMSICFSLYVRRGGIATLRPVYMFSSSSSSSYG